jgi:hypothetical protein
MQDLASRKIEIKTPNDYEVPRRKEHTRDPLYMVKA